MQKNLEQSGDKVDELANVLDVRLQSLSSTLRNEMQKAMNLFRNEMQLTYEKQRQQLKWAAFWQWMDTIALFIGVY